MLLIQKEGKLSTTAYFSIFSISIKFINRHLFNTLLVCCTSNILAAVHRTSAEVWTTPYHRTVSNNSWYTGLALKENKT